MNTLQFLSQLRSLDIELSAANGRLRLSAPKGVLSPELRNELSQRRGHRKAAGAAKAPYRECSRDLGRRRVDFSHLLGARRRHLVQLDELAGVLAAWKGCKKQ